MPDILEPTVSEIGDEYSPKDYQKALLNELNSDPIFCHLDKEIVKSLANLIELEEISVEHPEYADEILANIKPDKAISFFNQNHKQILPFLRRIELTRHMDNNYTVKYLRTLPELADSGITHFQCASTLYRNNEYSDYYPLVATSITNMLLRQILEICPPGID